MAVIKYSHNDILAPDDAQRLFVTATIAASVDDSDDEIQGDNLQDIKTMVATHASPITPQTAASVDDLDDEIQQKDLQDVKTMVATHASPITSHPMMPEPTPEPASPGSAPRSGVVKGILHARLKRRGVKLPHAVTK